MKILVTGADGFIGRNLCLAIAERGCLALPIIREHSEADVRAAIAKADVVMHLAGVNRPQDPAEFATGNAGLTQTLCALLAESDRKLPIALSSSIQAERDNPYGLSKKAAEQAVLDYGRHSGAVARVYRLPNVFGKWCRPNYNSAVATFCHNIARGLPIQINEPSAALNLVYVDDVVAELLAFAQAPADQSGFSSVDPVYQTTVGEVAAQISAFQGVRMHLISEAVGTGLVRALYSTYISYLTPEQFSYPVAQYADPRGVFVEMLKTKDSGQFSYFTAHPGITRGGHYHHSKTEKFLVMKGKALFKFRHMLSGETYRLETSGELPVVVETIPGWAHDITNIGDDEMLVLLWANEIFDRARPDTIAAEVF
jgi:UDP-2-acetamido-2,6-beta-L-arabino-hexul-4-ose reductase